LKVKEARIRIAMRYYTGEDGNLDHLRPMTRDEAIEAYRQIADEEPESLADLYVDFHIFSQVEFLIFRDRLSSAILISNSAKKAIDEFLSKFEAIRREGSHIVPGWEAESDLALDESLGVTRDAYQVSIGATILTAVAALESLLIDLTPDSEPKPKGLSRLIRACLRRYKVPAPQADPIMKMTQEVGKRRNTFAHSLTGSYWETDETIAAIFTPQTLEDTLYTVGKIAVLMEESLLVG
jgi:hypothetical protein